MRESLTVWIMIAWGILLFPAPLTALPVGASEWTAIASTPTRETYYDRGRIEILDPAGGDIRRVWVKAVLKEEGQREALAFLQRLDQGPNPPDLVSHVEGLHEIDCSQGRIRDVAIILYGREDLVLHASPQGETGPWKDIVPASVGELLKESLCKEPAGTLAAAAPDPAPSPQEAAKPDPQAAVRTLITRWLESWQAGDMQTYRDCYASGFTSRGMNREVWTAYKSRLHKKSGKIEIRIGGLRIEAAAQTATATFVQHYRSSRLRESGEKRLELRKIDGQWRILKESM